MKISVITNIAFSDKTIPLIQAADLAVKRTGLIGAILLGVGVVFAVMWRVYSQIWMEIEVFGDKHEVNQYLRQLGATKSKTYAFQTGPTTTRRILWKFFKYGSGSCIAASWACLIYVAASLLRLY